MSQITLGNNSCMDDNILLHLAVIEENRDVVKFLLKHNVPVNGRAINKQLALEFLTDSEHQRHMESALDGKSIIGDDAGEEKIESLLSKTTTALHLAARNESNDMAEYLLQHGADVNAEMEGGETPLIVAVLNKRASLVELLIERGADVNARTAWGKSPLHYAAQNGSKQIVEMLVQNGSHVNAANLQGMTPLHLAAESGHKDVVNALMKRSADANIRTKDGATPLHYAAVMGHKDVVEVILNNGADINVLLKQGGLDLTPFKWVTAAEERKVWELISKYTSKLSIRNIFNAWIFKKNNKDKIKQNLIDNEN